ncbi:hypothetical protein TNCV_4971381 [Trichonephila clavipes]|nr:hypothetical protein TNCV_4971381 [Trichonephila clavipes]
MSSRNHIDDFMRSIGKIKKGEKQQMLPGGSTSLTALFHGCGSHLKLLECVVGRVSTTPISSLYRRTTAQQVANHKLFPDTIRTQTNDQTAPVLPVCNFVSITIGLNRTGHAYYSKMRIGPVCQL